MNEQTTLNVKEVITSFKYWPKVFQLLWDIDKKAFLIILICVTVSGAIPALLLLANQFLINSIQLSWGQGFELVLQALAVLIGIYLFQIVVNQVKQYTEEVYNMKLSYSVNSMLMKKSYHLALEDFENDKIYDQLQRAQSEANHRPYQILQQILAIISSAVTFVTTAAILFTWKWWIVPCLLIIPILSTYYFLKLGKTEFVVEYKRAPLWRKLWYLNYLLTKDVTFKEVKLNNLGAHIANQYKQIYFDFLNVDKKIAKKRLTLSFTFQSINQVVIGGLTLFILFAAYMQQILIGTMVSYIQALTSTQNASSSLLQQIFSMYQNNLYIEQLFAYLEVEERDFDQGEEKDKEKLETIESIEFRNVSFKYPGSQQYALKNVSFIIEKNDIVAIVGKNGSGKSTLVKLLTRLYKNYSGQILINDKPIETYTVQSVREQIGVVFQDFVKYELTVRENIGYGNLTQMDNDYAIYQAAHKTGIFSLIESFPQKLDTQLGKWFEDGHQLSGGQWQKIAIARAFMKDSSMFVLDEPSSALDPQAEKEIFDKFHSLTKDKIGLYISHRFTTVKHATNILVLDAGTVVESGTHESLMRRNGLYNELYGIQASMLTNNQVQLQTGGVQ